MSKPIIETLVNTAALALTSFGVITLTQDGHSGVEQLKGIFLICFGMGLEYFKYKGRKKKLW